MKAEFAYKEEPIMISFPIALQLYSVRDDMAADFEGTLRKVKAMGYDGVEFAGLFGHTPQQVKAMCEKAGLVPVSAHVPFAELMADPAGQIAAYKEIGCFQVVIPYLPEELRPGRPGFATVIEGAKILGAECKKQGMLLGYHNHDFEFEKLDGEYALDVLYREVPAELLQTQLDTCWVNVGGEDPVAYVRKYAGRTPTVHLKDFVGEKTANMYALIGLDEEKTAAPAFGFRPVGCGKQDFPAILAASEAAGAKWVIVEQDEPALDKTALECAQMSVEYLKTL
jgi:sugar phosphate isomerase/epimerase